MGEFYYSFRTKGPYSGSEEASKNIYVFTSSIKISHRCRALKAKKMYKNRDAEVFLLNLLLL